jgi:hypothetical protein
LESRAVPSANLIPTNNNSQGYAAIHISEETQTFVPPDTCGAAGPTAYVETVNQILRLYQIRGTGGLPTSANFSTFWGLTGGLPRASGASFFSDPIVTYDEKIGRFIVGDQDVDFNSHVSKFDIAVSKTDSPASLSATDWNFYQIDTTETGFDADYPGNFGYNADAFVFTLNMFSVGPVNDHVLVTSVSTADLANGVPQSALRVFHNDLDNFSVRPTTIYDAVPGGPMWFVSAQTNSIDVIKMTDVLSNSATFDTTNLAVKPYSKVVAPLNPDGSAITFNIDSRIIKASSRNGRLVASHSVGASGTEDDIQWYDIDISGATPTLSDQGRISAGNNTYLTYPAIDINAAGQLGMTFMRSGNDSPSDFMSMYITGRDPSDPAGTMQAPVLVPAGTGVANNGDGRAGDLSGINVDPVNGTFWAINEMATNDFGGSWGTAVANFSIGPAIQTGNVTTKILKGRLTLTGDDNENDIQIKLQANGDALITGVGGTTINGQANVNIVGPVTDLTALLNGGDDSVTIDSAADFKLTGNVSFDLGNGNNSLNFFTTGLISIGGSLKVRGGIGSNSAIVDGGATSSVAGRTQVSVGKGNSYFRFRDVTLGGAKVAVTAGKGASTLTVDNVQAAGALSLAGTAGPVNSTVIGSKLGALSVSSIAKAADSLVLHMTSTDVSKTVKATSRGGATARINAGTLGSLSVSGGSVGPVDTSSAGIVDVTGSVSVRGAAASLDTSGATLALSVNVAGSDSAALAVGVPGGLATTGNVAVKASRGTASLDATGLALTVGGGLTVTGSKQASVLFGTTDVSEVFGNFSVKGGRSGSSVITSGRFKVDGDVNLRLTGGNNTVILGSVSPAISIDGDLNITTGDGVDGVLLTNVQVGGNTRLNLGAEADNLSIVDGSTFTGTTLINLGAGSDTLAIASTVVNTAVVTFTGATRILAGKDNDTIKLGLSIADGGNANTAVAFVAPTNTLDLGTGTDTFDPAASQINGTLKTLGLP